MERLTIRVPEDLSAAIEERAETEDVSDSAAARDLLRRGTEYGNLQRELEQTEARVEDLRRQLQEATAGGRDVDELVEYVEGEMAKQERDRERRDAPVWRRAKWWVFGRSDDHTEA